MPSTEPCSICGELLTHENPEAHWICLGNGEHVDITDEPEAIAQMQRYEEMHRQAAENGGWPPGYSPGPILGTFRRPDGSVG